MQNVEPALISEMSKVSRIIGAVIVMVLFGPIELILALIGIGSLREVITALITGVYQRTDLIGAGELVQISKTTDPSGFWYNVEFWGFVSAICLLGAAPILIPLGLYMKVTFWPSRKSAS